MQAYREVALQVMVIIWNIVFLCPRVLLFGKSRIIFAMLYGVGENPAHSVEAINFDDFSCTLLVQSVRCIGILDRQLNSSRTGTVFLIAIEPQVVFAKALRVLSR